MCGITCCTQMEQPLTDFSDSPAHLDSTAEGERHSSGVPASAASFSTSIVLPGSREAGGQQQQSGCPAWVQATLDKI